MFPTYLLIITQRDGQGRWNVDIKFQTISFRLPDVETCDVDNCYVIKLCDHEEYGVVKKALRSQFFDYDIYRRDCPALWQRRRLEKGDSFLGMGRFIGYDEAGNSVARKMLDFVFENRLALGDNGEWHLWTFRDRFLQRAGVNLTDMGHEEIKKLVVVKPLPNADYTDELESFRFPSVSCLYGVSQPISELRGAVTFRRLFIQDGAGVYLAFDDNVVLYVGMSQQFSQRLCNAASHHKLKMILDRHPQARVAVLHYPDWKMTECDEVVTDAELEAVLARMRDLLLAFERACIEHYQPRYNGRWVKEDKSDDSLEMS